MANQNSKLKILHFGLSFCILIFAFCILAQRANAATLYFSPSSGSFNVGQTFSVSVFVSSPDQIMNAAGGVVSFPRDKLEITSLSKAGSIITLWAQEPAFSNAAGSVNFEGIILPNGFMGQAGRIITLNFRTRTVGAAGLRFQGVSVLAHDGIGTNILTRMGNANFSIGVVEPDAPEIITPAEAPGAPDAPKIQSPTHPNPNKWYALRNTKFTWDLPMDVTGVRLLAGRVPTEIPTITHIPPIRERKLTNLADGIWYFSARLRNDAGWGAVSRFRFQIDTERPVRFEIREIRREDLTNPRVKFRFDARDETSGIDYYEIRINGGNPQIWRDDGSGIYETPLLDPGRHALIARAFDKAGNSRVNALDFEIKGLEPPIITEYPKQLPSGEPLIIKGTTKYPNAQTVVWFQRDDEEAKSQIARNDAEGNFILVVAERPRDGIYKIWAEVIDGRGARSMPSEKITISVDRSAFLRIGAWAVGLLAVVVPLVALIFILLFIIWYGWHRFSLFRKGILKETEQAEKALHRAFRAIKKEMEEQVAKLDGKPDLNKREKEICDSLKRVLQATKKSIGKEIKDIEKEI